MVILTSSHRQVSLPVPAAEATLAANRNTVAKASFLTTFFHIPTGYKEEQCRDAIAGFAGMQWQFAIRSDSSCRRHNKVN